MRIGVLLGLLLATGACARSDPKEQQALVDPLLRVEGVHTMVDSVAQVVTAHANKQLTADAAAKVILDIGARSPQTLNVELPADIREALARELKRRRAQGDSAQ